MIKTPHFWRSKNIVAITLVPISFVYGVFSYLVQKIKIPYKSKLPVICVGNITAVGDGKTPLCIEVIKILKEMGFQPAVISRGYGGSNSEAIKVDCKIHDYTLVGDEPLLISRYAPVYVSKNKKHAIKLAEKDNIDILIMDDGLQSRSIYKDASLLVIDGLTGLGNKLLIPAGPLRQRLSSIVKKIDAIVLIGEDKNNLESDLGNKVLRANIVTILPIEASRKKVIAFAGIAYPEKFFLSLEKMNCTIVRKYNFADHYPYLNQDLEEMIKEANQLQALLITTEKDYIRIPEVYKPLIKILPMELEFAYYDIEKLKLLFKGVLKDEA